MKVINTTTTSNQSTLVVRSVFFCPQIPGSVWDFKSSTFAWILAATIFAVSPVTVLLNSLVIVAIKKKKELQKHSNILLCSMAITDLLTGAITMPLSATIDALVLSQASFDHICTLNILVNKPMIFILSLSSLYHLTAIAWERYMAIQNWMDYKITVTKGLLKKLGITAWVLAVVIQAPTVIRAITGVDLQVLLIWFVGASVVIVGCLIAIAYFYIMVFLAVRKRKQNQISQVTVSMKAKLESKVAKTTALLTAATILSFVPSVFVTPLAKIIPVLRFNSAFRIAETLMQFNSLVSPVLYCYRDRHFLLAVRELLGMRISPHVQRQVDAARLFRRKHRSGSVKLATHNLKETTLRSPRSASTDPSLKIGESSKISPKSSMSDPALNKYGNSSLASSIKPQQPSSILTTSVVIQKESSNQCKPRNSKGKIHPILPNVNETISPKGSADRK